MTPNMSAAAKDRETEQGAPQPIRHMRAAAHDNDGPDQTAKRSVTRMRDNNPMRTTGKELDPNARLEKLTSRKVLAWPMALWIGWMTKMEERNVF